MWNSEFVTDAAIATGLHTVRLAVGDTGRRQQFIRTVHGRGYQFFAQATETPKEPSAAIDTTASSRDTIRFCRTPDGTRIAWAATGAGRPLVKTASWLSRLDMERATPIFTHRFEGLTRG